VTKLRLEQLETRCSPAEFLVGLGDTFHVGRGPYPRPEVPVARALVWAPADLQPGPGPGAPAVTTPRLDVLQYFYGTGGTSTTVSGFSVPRGLK